MKKNCNVAFYTKNYFKVKVHLMVFLTGCSACVDAASPFESTGKWMGDLLTKIAPSALTLCIIVAGILWWTQKASMKMVYGIIGGSILIFGAPWLANEIVGILSQ